MSTDAIAIDIVSPNWQGDQLLFAATGQNVIELRLRASVGSLTLRPGDATLNLVLNQHAFATLDDDQIAAPDGWTAALSGNRLTLAPVKDVVIDAGGVLLTAPLPPLRGPVNEPKGTVEIGLTGSAAGRRLVSLSVLARTNTPHATPPVAVTWRNGVMPELTLNRPGSLEVVIANVRLDRKGNPKPLVTRDALFLRARIRLSFPKVMDGAQLVAIADDRTLNDVEPHYGGTAKRFLKTDRQTSWEFDSTVETPEFIEKGGVLSLKLDKVTPKRAGIFQLCVTFVDLPGYLGHTVTLPLRVIDPAENAILDFVAVTNGHANPTRGLLFWRLADLSHDGEGCVCRLEQAGIVQKNVAVKAGQYEHPFSVGQTTEFTLVINRDSQERQRRSVTVYVQTP